MGLGLLLLRGNLILTDDSDDSIDLQAYCGEAYSNDCNAVIVRFVAPALVITFSIGWSFS